MYIYAITFGSFPFVNALLILSIIPPSPSCKLCIQFECVLWIVLPTMTLRLFAYHFGSFPFVNALLIHAIIPPLASCLLCIQFKSVPWVLFPTVTLHIIAFHIWFLSLCECSLLHLFHHWHLVCWFNSLVSCGYCVTHCDFTYLHFTFGSFPFVNALLTVYCSTFGILFIVGSLQ